MEAARTRTAAVIGVEGHMVEVEAEIARGLPATILTGLPDTVLREARDRVRAAIVNSGERWPSAKITVGLRPAVLPKRGSAYDLAIAIAIMAANGDLPAPPEGAMFVSELGLDGRLRPVTGVLPAALAAAHAEITTIVVAAANQAEADLVPGLTVIAADSLTGVARWLRGGPPPHQEPPGPGSGDGPVPPQPDLADVLGQAEARRALEVCAVGGHHLSLLGPAGTGKTMLAERLPTILPPLDTAAALEVASIHSVAGALTPGTGLVTTPPFVAPHHTSSKAAMIGGGSGLIRPGAASLAHRGVLFLDQTPEFHQDVLNALRQPLESGKVVIARASDGGSRTGGNGVPVLADGSAALPWPVVGAAAGPGERQGLPPAGQPRESAGWPRVRRAVCRGRPAGRGGTGTVRGTAGRDPVATEFRDPRLPVAPGIPPGGRVAEAAGAGDGARPGISARRGPDRPGRVVFRRPRRQGPARTR
jgi:magnesium chelatase family protein